MGMKGRRPTDSILLGDHLVSQATVTGANDRTESILPTSGPLLSLLDHQPPPPSLSPFQSPEQSIKESHLCHSPVLNPSLLVFSQSQSPNCPRLDSSGPSGSLSPSYTHSFLLFLEFHAFSLMSTCQITLLNGVLVSLSVSLPLLLKLQVAGSNPPMAYQVK